MTKRDKKPRPPPSLVVALTILSTASLLASTLERPRSGQESAGLGWREQLEALKKKGSGGQFTEAAAEARKLLATVEAEFGPESLESADILHELVYILLREGREPVDALTDMAERVTAIREGKLGPDAPAVAAALTNLGHLRRARGDNTGAAEYHRRALAIREKAFGTEHPDIASSLRNIANALMLDLKLTDAEPLFARALEMRRRLQGEHHPNIGTILFDLGMLEDLRGAVRKALGHFQQAAAVYEKAYGPEHPSFSNALNSIAICYDKLGLYGQAKREYERALAVNVKMYGADHREVARVQHNLAVVLENLGYLTEAVELRRSVREIWDRTLSPNHPDRGLNLYHEGRLARARRLPAEARTRMEEALEVWERLPDMTVELRASVLMDLGSLHEEAGEVERARAQYEQALQMWETSMGPDHPFVGLGLVSLARLDSRSDPQRARRFLERSLEIDRVAFGQELRPPSAQTMSQLAAVVHRLGEPEAAWETALSAHLLQTRWSKLHVQTLPESKALNFGQLANQALDLALSMLVLEPSNSMERAQQGWNAVVISRAIVLDELVSRHRLIVGQGDPDLSDVRESLLGARESLSALVLRGAQDLDPHSYRRLLDEARAERDRLEVALAERSFEFRQSEAQAGADLDSVSRSLPSRTALVAFVLYGQHSLESAAAPPVPSYLAFVRTADGATFVVPLGPAAEVDDLIRDWRAQIDHEALAGGLSSKRQESAYRLRASELRRRIWDPVAEHLTGSELVFVVPDGPLNLVSFEALPAADEYLVEVGPTLHYLSAERDLLRRGRSHKGQGLLAFGNPSFDDDGLFAATRKSSLRGGRTDWNEGPAPYRGPRSACGRFELLRFEALPATAREVDSVSELWTEMTLRNVSPDATGSGLVYTGAAASETLFKEEAPGKRVLHLATHGFFLGGECSSALDTDLAGGIDLGSSENPMLLSGLVLAGANHRSAAGVAEDDGILTAEEIASLDLGAAELAVLSACDTGIGEIRPGEGVFGLRRALQLAGVATTLTSLWQVEDDSTREWMESFYLARFLEGASVSEARRRASRQLLQKRREAGLSTHPFYWAGFVAAGAWN